MPPVGFEPTISVGERPKTYALDRAATGTGEVSGYRLGTVYRILLTQFVNINCRVLQRNMTDFE